MSANTSQSPNNSKKQSDKKDGTTVKKQIKFVKKESLMK